MSKKIVIAVDGFSSCGKSSFAKLIAQRLGYLYIDSGAMYRAVTLGFIQNGLIENGVVKGDGLLDNIKRLEVGFSLNPKTKKHETTLNGVVVEEQIRTISVANLVSVIAAVSEVRERMVELQRKLGIGKGIVMDGRDIGTVVFPSAELKIFMTAEPKIRAERRLKEMIEKGQEVNLAEILANIEERDYLDQTRAISPLRKADDAIILDNSLMTIDEQMVWVEKLIEERIK
ncbi:MAG: (d)CMP kinase [Bacteroidales bacterium]|nr:MAG: (d)CMP kinase [Bacteroidales bacterium]